MQYSFEQTGSDLSIYTRYLVEGIETGAADLNKDGQISVDELHQYAELKVKEAAPAMSPKIIVLKDEGFRIELAKVALGDPKLLYRQEVERVVQENQGLISDLDRLDLDDIRNELNLAVSDAEEIESSILQPFRELAERVEFYRRAFQAAIAQQYPLDQLQRQTLKRIQDRKQLQDEDVQKIEAQIISAFQITETAAMPVPITPAQTMPETTEQSPKAQVAKLDPDHESDLSLEASASITSTSAQVVSELNEQSPETQIPQKIVEENHLSSERGIDYTQLQNLLKAGKWKEADKETADQMLRAMKKENWLRVSGKELLKFPETDLKTIDQLWVKHSNGRFGFSVQKAIYIKCGANPNGRYPGSQIWEHFCNVIGWRDKKKEQHIFYFDVIFSTSAPRGHLPFLEWGGALRNRERVYFCLLSHRGLQILRR